MTHYRKRYAPTDAQQNRRDQLADRFPRFDPWQWREWVTAAHNPVLGASSKFPCQDCLPCHQKKMIDDQRCRFPEVVFTAVEGEGTITGIFPHPSTEKKESTTP